MSSTEERGGKWERKKERKGGITTVACGSRSPSALLRVNSSRQRNPWVFCFDGLENFGFATGESLILYGLKVGFQELGMDEERDKMNSQPNIFKFATSELSQDAFICWLLSYVNHPEEKKLNECAKDFIALLYNLKKGQNWINGTNVEGIVNLKQQYCHIDVYFQAVIDKRRVSFIIEDKTYTSYHSNQLKRYRDAIKDKIKEEELVCIYFKTGYIYPWDEKAKDKDYGYAILDYKEIHNFLQKYKTDNLIFEGYKEYIRKEFYEPQTTGTRKLLDDKKINVFEKDFVQWEFMKKLLEECKQNINPDKMKDPILYNGKNRDGTAWTQMWFVKFKGVYGKDLNESIFYRLDKRKNPESKEAEFYLSIRQYGYVKDNPEAKKIKLDRLEEYKRLFKDTISGLFGDEKNCPLEFSTIRGDNSGANESEIAILFFGNAKNTPNEVLRKIREIHKRFVEGIKSSELMKLGAR